MMTCRIPATGASGLLAHLALVRATGREIGLARDGDMDRSSVDRFLGRLGGTAARKMREAGMRAEFRRGDLLLRAGEGGDVVHLITEGRVKVTSSAFSGREVILDFGWPGDLYGEMSVLTGESRIANVVALERVVTRRIAAQAFRRLLAELPEVHRGTLLIMTHRLAAANAQRTTAPSDDVKVLVARRLLELVEVCGERTAQGWRIDLPLTNREIAQYVSASESSVYAALARFRSLGLVERGRYRETVVTDPERLRSVIIEPSG